MSQVSIPSANDTHPFLVTPILKLFFNILIPIVIALLLSGLHYFIDGIFISLYVGSMAMGAVSLIMPVQLLISALAAMISAGAAVLIARQLGAREKENANMTFSAASVLAFILSLACAFIGYFAMDELLHFLKVTPAFDSYAVEYAQPILIGAVLTICLTLLADCFDYLPDVAC
ncbi:MATE family efflux transporter [Enterovibrio nigricans]|uniref:MatE protein n=1 Tax=Enterovibrio nigricans DSM 22720 TaxID=1121868 RepID=A0A1T4UBV6_9GAMM|nr:MATE family efflux transporter [Enterovibrio nigricans]PKF51482.1 hypothetical protein AT251_03690 [Enterovibrio nigricans]SKA50173.1 MatE protein [Enterovibrio nigricans DSM 22720]